MKLKMTKDELHTEAAIKWWDSLEWDKQCELHQKHYPQHDHPDSMTDDQIELIYELENKPK